MTQLSYIGIRMKAAWVVLVLIFAYLAYHMYTVQILRHDELYAKAKSTTTRETFLSAISPAAIFSSIRRKPDQRKSVA